MSFAFYCLVMAVTMATAALVTLHRQVAEAQAAKLSEPRTQSWRFAPLTSDAAARKGD